MTSRDGHDREGFDSRRQRLNGALACFAASPQRHTNGQISACTTAGVPCRATLSNALARRTPFGASQSTTRLHLSVHPRSRSKTALIDRAITTQRGSTLKRLARSRPVHVAHGIRCRQVKSAGRIKIEGPIQDPPSHPFRLPVRLSPPSHTPSLDICLVAAVAGSFLPARPSFRRRGDKTFVFTDPPPPLPPSLAAPLGYPKRNTQKVQQN